MKETHTYPNITDCSITRLFDTFAKGNTNVLVSSTRWQQDKTEVY